jgi:hypothetical protein
MQVSGQEHNKPQNSKEKQPEAFAGVAFAAIAADRDIKDIELLYLQTIFSRTRLFSGWTAEQYKAVFEKLHQRLNTHGWERLLEESARALSPDLYQSIFAISLDLVLSDGIVRDEEEEFLYKLQKQLGIAQDLASKITHVIAIKNQC